RSASCPSTSTLPAPSASCHGAALFFQAEDGIRGGHVTGVQTCALPIYASCGRIRSPGPSAFSAPPAAAPSPSAWLSSRRPRARRSEERRVGKSVDLGGRRVIEKRRAGW